MTKELKENYNDLKREYNEYVNRGVIPANIKDEIDDGIKYAFSEEEVKADKEFELNSVFKNYNFQTAFKCHFKCYTKCHLNANFADSHSKNAWNAI